MEQQNCHSKVGKQPWVGVGYELYEATGGLGLPSTVGGGRWMWLLMELARGHVLSFSWNLQKSPIVHPQLSVSGLCGADVRRGWTSHLGPFSGKQRWSLTVGLGERCPWIRVRKLQESWGDVGLPPRYRSGIGILRSEKSQRTQWRSKCIEGAWVLIPKEILLSFRRCLCAVRAPERWRYESGIFCGSWILSRGWSTC